MTVSDLKMEESQLQKYHVKYTLDKGLCPT